MLEWSERPSWLGPKDMIALTIKVIVGIEEMHAILKIREQRNE